jgi:hypothetical protein
VNLFVNSLLLVFISSSVFAQSLSGRWIGTLNYKIETETSKLNISLEVEQKGNDLFGVISLRNNNKGNIIGSDHLVHAEIKGDKILFKPLQLIKNYGMSIFDFSMFQRAEGTISINGEQAEIRASAFLGEDNYLGSLGTLKLKKEDPSLSQLSIDVINSFKKLYFPDSSGNYIIKSAVFRNIAYPKRIVEKGIIDFRAAKKNNPDVKVAIYFDGIKLEEWSSAQDNYIEMDINGLEKGTHIIVLKVETKDAEPVSFAMRRADRNRVQEVKYTISPGSQLNLIMNIYNRPS